MLLSLLFFPKKKKTDWDRLHLQHALVDCSAIHVLWIALVILPLSEGERNQSDSLYFTQGAISKLLR